MNVLDGYLEGYDIGPQRTLANSAGGAPGFLSGAMSNPMLLAGMGMMGAAHDRRLNPFGGALQGLQMGMQNRRAEEQYKMQSDLLDLRKKQFGLEEMKFDQERKNRESAAGLAAKRLKDIEAYIDSPTSHQGTTRTPEESAYLERQRQALALAASTGDNTALTKMLEEPFQKFGVRELSTKDLLTDYRQQPSVQRFHEQTAQRSQITNLLSDKIFPGMSRSARDNSAVMMLARMWSSGPVTDTDFARAESEGGFPERFRQWFFKSKTGELTPEQRQGIRMSAENIYQATHQTLQGMQGRMLESLGGNEAALGEIAFSTGVLGEYAPLEPFTGSNEWGLLVGKWYKDEDRWPGDKAMRYLGGNPELDSSWGSKEAEPPSGGQ